MLFGFKVIHGVEPGCLQRLETDGAQGDQQGYCRGEQEYPDADMDTIGEILQPLVHQPPGDRGGDDEGQ